MRYLGIAALVAAIAAALVALLFWGLSITGDLAGLDVGASWTALALAGVVILALIAGFIALILRGR